MARLLSRSEMEDDDGDEEMSDEDVARRLRELADTIESEEDDEEDDPLLEEVRDKASRGDDVYEVDVREIQGDYVVDIDKSHTPDSRNLGIFGRIDGVEVAYVGWNGIDDMDVSGLHVLLSRTGGES